MIDRDQSLTDFTKPFEEITILRLNVENLTISTISKFFYILRKYLQLFLLEKIYNLKLKIQNLWRN